MTKSSLNHPIVEQSFAIIDQEIGEHNLNSLEYAIARRVIHSTADFDFIKLLKFSPDAIQSGINSLQQKTPIITDVTMVKQGIVNLVRKTFNNPIITAVEAASQPLPGKTRTETGLLTCFETYPNGIYVIGNAPTALLALCQQITAKNSKPSLIIGAPVGFVSVLESKQALTKIDVPKILVEGRKGGSSVAAAIINALLVLGWESKQSLL
ncbi:cobalt-precorrin-8X methylmutase [Crocosphaera sp. XPORK-15E]|uniref:cobalt-precorrin-8X methylmutase n=1 Tax=Crocosphaera sp. XPORK-15E TaxID=3110247 RepID=UPI002B1EA316|nr:cobalt-precorrin-8X methylmutase [Crocosphaera sp. XPORK-15E]MEA5536480.1 cobalt-precorrin-8X methylmutase [Crocosphaera sp. XPORK-15E]